MTNRFTPAELGRIRAAARSKNKRLEWTKSGRDWFAIWGKYRAEVRAPDRVSPSLGFYHWSVRAGDKLGGSGGTSSVQTSKRAAEAEIDRLIYHRSEDK